MTDQEQLDLNDPNQRGLIGAVIPEADVAAIGRAHYLIRRRPEDDGYDAEGAFPAPSHSSLVGGIWS